MKGDGAMSDKIVSHPCRDLMAEAAHERAVADSAEGQALQRAIFEAVWAYSDFLDRSGVIWGDKYRLKAQALIITVDYGADAGSSVDIHLKDGAVDRVYGNASIQTLTIAARQTSRISGAPND
jgi:hypothetical protein